MEYVRIALAIALIGKQHSTMSKDKRFIKILLGDLVHVERPGEAIMCGHVTHTVALFQPMLMDTVAKLCHSLS